MTLKIDPVSPVVRPTVGFAISPVEASMVEASAACVERVSPISEVSENNID